VILRFGFDYMQRNGDGDPDERTWLRDETGGSIYLRLSTRPLEQPARTIDDELEQRAIVDGAYWLRKPGPNAEVVIAYTGAVAPEAIEATGLLGRGPPRHRPARHHLGRPAQRRLDGGRDGPASAASSMRSRMSNGCSPTCRIIALVTVLDGHPATLGWLGSVHGHTSRHGSSGQARG
jgi:pyruvate dehydrogenase E1 component